jgi:PTS system ascorbate-specific IIA component
MPAVLIVAHAPLASALKSVASHVYADVAHAVEALDVPPDADVAKVQSLALALMSHSQEDEWLVLTDVFGATPCNAMASLAGSAERARHMHVLAGVNVPMLWRTLCYADESLDQLTARALDGAGRGVVQVVPGQDTEKGPAEPSRDQVDHHHQQ